MAWNRWMSAKWVTLAAMLCVSVAQTAEKPIELLFTYGSEKEKWIEDVTAAFNRGNHTFGNGKRIQVQAIPMGSGEAMEELLAGKRKAHLVSPASAAFIVLGNAQSRDKTGKDLVGTTQNLVLSPVVIAMWKPMAEAMGWGKQPVGWADILAMADNPEGWAAHGYPQWGRFKFGHTHPEYSNSGLISLLAEAYAGAGKAAGLTVEDVQKPDTRQYIAAVEQSVIHYGRSTGFFGRKMFENGPEYLSAAVLYENMVIESYDPQYPLPFPIVAIYPKEGTFWSDHPVAIVERDWVTPEHREAAKVYIDYLLARPQQEKAMVYGFRPADVEIPLVAPIDTAHGVDPKEPKTTLEVPPAKVINALLAAWKDAKKHANVVLVLDVSGSMKGPKILNARNGALKLLAGLGDADRLSLLAFNNRVNWVEKDITMKDKRDAAETQIKQLFAAGGTALYDAVAAAYQKLSENPQPDRISAVVVLSDGADTDSKLKLEELLKTIRFDNETRTTRVFTIGYGADANESVLKQIADATQAKYYQGTPENIAEVFKDTSTFF
jgi:Ca-activated chloride channel family protein